MSRNALEKIDVHDNRLIRTVHDNIKNIHEYLAMGYQIVVTVPLQNIFFVLTTPEQIREDGGMYYAVCKKKTYRVYAHNVFFVPQGCTLL
jgi:hypothetical protein